LFNKHFHLTRNQLFSQTSCPTTPHSPLGPEGAAPTRPPQQSPHASAPHTCQLVVAATERGGARGWLQVHSDPILLPQGLSEGQPRCRPKTGLAERQGGSCGAVHSCLGSRQTRSRRHTLPVHSCRQLAGALATAHTREAPKRWRALSSTKLPRQGTRQGAGHTAGRASKSGGKSKSGGIEPPQAAPCGDSVFFELFL